MSNREIVLDWVRQIPEEATLEEIAERIEFLAGTCQAREEAARGEGTPAEDMRKLIREWAGQ